MSFPRRIVGDHHVDRPQVEAQQCVQPSGTNHPYGLIPPLFSRTEIGCLPNRGNAEKNRIKNARNPKRRNSTGKTFITPPCGCQGADEAPEALDIRYWDMGYSGACGGRHPGTPHETNDRHWQLEDVFRPDRVGEKIPNHPISDHRMSTGEARPLVARARRNHPVPSRTRK